MPVVAISGTPGPREPFNTSVMSCDVLLLASDIAAADEKVRSWTSVICPVKAEPRMSTVPVAVMITLSAGVGSAPRLQLVVVAQAGFAPEMVLDAALAPIGTRIRMEAIVLERMGLVFIVPIEIWGRSAFS